MLLFFFSGAHFQRRGGFESPFWEPMGGIQGFKMETAAAGMVKPPMLLYMLECSGDNKLQGGLSGVQSFFL